MFKKVLLAEDIDTVNIAVVQVLEDMQFEVHFSKYCDDALLKLKKASIDNQPFDLVISDLSFELDHREVNLKSGEELIQNIRILQPKVPILVYSIEDKNYRIKALFEKYKVNAFVHKSRKSIQELKTAIQMVSNGNSYISPDMEHILRDKSISEIDDYDIQLIKQLANGIAQEKMEDKFKELGISPSSKSTIEKRIGKLKDYFKANNTVHLIAIAKDLGIA
jgi:two-component system, NarL family, captular synthesis response regulator RcsB